MIKLKEVLDIKDSSEYELKRVGNDFEGQFRVGDELFEVEVTPSKIHKNIQRFSFRLIDSPHKQKPTSSPESNDKNEMGDWKQYYYGQTNSNNSFKVFSMIMSVMYRFIKTHQPDGIWFRDVDEGPRAFAYEGMAKRVARKTGYYYFEKHDNYLLIKDKDYYTKFKAEYGETDD